MERKTPFRLTLPQSQANDPQRPELEALLSQVPALTAIEVRKQLRGGYGQCRVFLARPTFDKPAPNAWIVKLGPRDEIEAEDAGYTIAKGHIDPARIVGKIGTYYIGDLGALIYDFVGFTGRDPIDLEKALSKIESVKAIEAAITQIDRWSEHPEWDRVSLSGRLKAWMEPKLENFPPNLPRDIPALNSPDFGQVYSNPIYHLSRDLKRVEVECPLGFVHGDLNLRNILFNVNTDNSVAVDAPTLIDFRHAKQGEIAVLDLAKLEACVRYTLLGRIESREALTQAVSFLASSRERLKLESPPEVIDDKGIQELWRCITPLRSEAARLCNYSKDAEAAYWVCLLSYGLSTATYPQLPLEVRHLAFLDAAAIFTERMVPRDPAAKQFVLRVHDFLSPPVIVPGETSRADDYSPLLLRALEKGHVVLVVGGTYGKTAGFEAPRQLVQWLFKDLTGEQAPVVNPETLLEILSRRKPRQDIARALQKRVGRWGEAKELSGLEGIPWAAVINWNFTDEPYRVLSRSATGRAVIRVDTLGEVVAGVDQIKVGGTAYFPLLGDVASLPDSLALTQRDHRERWEVLGEVARAIELRQHPISLLFWRCEEVQVDELSKLRGNLISRLSVPVDTYFLSDQDDAVRDHALSALDIWRIPATLAELKANIALQTSEVSSQLPSSWQRDDIVYPLPDIGRLTRGLIRPFSEVGALGLPPAESCSESFLLGAPPTEDDILDGRVVRRKVLESKILPSIRNLLEAGDRRLRALLVEGRAGAGVTTLLLLAAHTANKYRWAPVYVVTRPAAGLNTDWEYAGELLGDVSRLTKRPVILFADAATARWSELENLCDRLLNSGGEIVPILGGRRELMRSLVRGVPSQFYQRIEVEDTLAEPIEWETLARILQQSGFSTRLETSDLASQLAAVGQLLPAIYQATDGMNRKFREIVAYEYHRYDADAFVQKAYRFVCHLGAFGQRISQYWLLKALGQPRLSDAVRILGLLSDDIIRYAEKQGETSDFSIGPRHQLIAEQVLGIATPEPSYRLSEIRQLIGAANLASQEEGTNVAHLLLYKGPLLAWIAEAFQGNRTAVREESLTLYKVALGNQPLHPRVEITLRQHYALCLRYHRESEEALEEIKRAMVLEPENPATTHIAGLIHVDRALASWDAFKKGGGPGRRAALGQAYGNEEDALDFFRVVRRQQPRAEYGYEPEARYFKSKLGILHSEDRDQDVEMKGLCEEARLQVAASLALLRNAEAVIPRDSLVEIPRTKAAVLHALGDTKQALALLTQEIEATRGDPVRSSRLKRAAAALAAEGGNWDLCIGLYEGLVADGERDAASYLLLDDALKAQHASVRRRLAVVRESAQVWNKNDIETLVRFSELLLYDEDWSAAVRALERANELGSREVSAYQRDIVRTVVREGNPYSTEERRFEGVVARLWKPFEGQVEIKDRGVMVFFRSSPELSEKLSVGEAVSFRVGVRVRGLRALGVERVQK